MFSSIVILSVKNATEKCQLCTFVKCRAVHYYVWAPPQIFLRLAKYFRRVRCVCVGVSSALFRFEVSGKGEVELELGRVSGGRENRGWRIA